MVGVAAGAGDLLCLTHLWAEWLLCSSEAWHRPRETPRTPSVKPSLNLSCPLDCQWKEYPGEGSYYCCGCVAFLCNWAAEQIWNTWSPACCGGSWGLPEPTCHQGHESLMSWSMAAAGRKEPGCSLHWDSVCHNAVIFALFPACPVCPFVSPKQTCLAQQQRPGRQVRLAHCWCHHLGQLGIAKLSPALHAGTNPRIGRSQQVGQTLYLSAAGRSSQRQDAQLPHCAWELLQECVCFRELSTHFASVCAASSSLLFRTLVLRIAGLGGCQSPDAGLEGSSEWNTLFFPVVSRTTQVLQLASTHCSARWTFHWISHNLLFFHVRGKSPNMGQTLLGCGASLGITWMTWAIKFSPKQQSSMSTQLTETTGYSCVGGQSSPKTAQGNKGVFLQIICYNLQKVNVGSEGELQLLSLKKREKEKPEPWFSEVSD